MCIGAFIHFFNCYLAAPRPILGHCRGGSFTNPMLITAFSYFDLKVTGNLVTRLGLKARPSTQWDLNREPPDSESHTLTHQATHLQRTRVFQENPVNLLVSDMMALIQSILFILNFHNQWMAISIRPVWFIFPGYQLHSLKQSNSQRRDCYVVLSQGHHGSDDVSTQFLLETLETEANKQTKTNNSYKIAGNF